MQSRYSEQPPIDEDQLLEDECSEEVPSIAKSNKVGMQLVFEMEGKLRVFD